MTIIEYVNDINEAKRALLTQTGIEITRTKKGKFHVPTATDDTHIIKLFDSTGYIGQYNSKNREIVIF